jgi:hypothetical protein
MAFNASITFTGTPDFRVVDINPEEVAKALQLYTERGSRLTGVSLDDIDTNLIELPADPKKATLADLIGKGMKLFDAIVWLTAGRPENPGLKKDPAMKKDQLISLHEIARSVFYCYFFLITQARYPATSDMSQKPKVANFLTVVMGMTKEQHVYVENICSFAPQKFDPAWVKHINFNGLGQEVLSRFGLGVAGYRMFGPFKLYEPKPNISANLKEAVAFAQAVAGAKPSWDVHPLTRSANILSARGNLNKNLANLILEVFTEEQIDEMVKAKILYSKPTSEPNYKNYQKWSSTDDITGSAFIFRG